MALPNNPFQIHIDRLEHEIFELKNSPDLEDFLHKSPEIIAAKLAKIKPLIEYKNNLIEILYRMADNDFITNEEHQY